MSDIIIASDKADVNNHVDGRNILQTLMRLYPGYNWRVLVNNGLADIRCTNLSGKLGFIIKLPSVYSASELDRLVMRAGGEILERYKVNRGKLQEDKLIELPKDFSGNHIPDRWNPSLGIAE